MSEEDNNRVKGISNKDLSLVGQMYKQGKLIDVSEMNSNLGVVGVKEPVVNTSYQLERVEKAILDLPKKMPKNSLHYNQQKKAMQEITKTQYNTLIKEHKIKTGVFS
jgi:hypothetical protein